MRKTFSKIITAILALCVALATLVGCGVGGWNTDVVTLKTPGNVYEQSLGGFVAETENYVYFINGIGANTDNNTLGNPLKGSLMAADKQDLTKTCVVVPKLFVATDYTAGVYIYNGYVYYGTPSTDKTTAGNIANTEMMFMRTKLDGTGTEVLFTVNSLSTQYRIVSENDTVYIVYYDSVEKALVNYNTKTAKSVVIAKTDISNKSESLNAYKFMDNKYTGETVVVYTVTVYTDEYSASEEQSAISQGSTYSRVTADYNRVYAYKVGDAGNDDCLGVKVLDGQGTLGKTYTVTLVSGNYVFYTVTDETSKPENILYGTTVSALYNKTMDEHVQIVNKGYAVDTAIIEDFDNVYVYAENYISKCTLVGNSSLEEVDVAKVTNVSKLLLKDADYIYYLNSENKLARIKIGQVEGERKAEIVSEGTISNSWYKIEIVDGKVYYCDTSTLGNSYVKCVAVDAPVDEETNELSGHILMGRKTDADKAQEVEAEIDEITSGLTSNKQMVFNDTDAQGLDTMKKYKEAKAAYDALTNKQKGWMSDESILLFEKYGKALEISRAIKPLNNFNELSDQAKDALENEFKAAKKLLDGVKNSRKFEYEEVTDLVVGSYMFEYQQAEKYFKNK